MMSWPTLRAGKTACEIVEFRGLPVGSERRIRRSTDLGPLPKRPPARADKMRGRVIAWMVANGLNDKVCSVLPEDVALLDAHP